MTSTIAAVASAPGAGLRAAIRVSGPRARAIVTSACRRGDRPLELVERAAVEATFVDDEGGLSVLILWMPGPRSFTAEDVAEIHLPGHPDLVQDALERLFALGAEPAQPGEFTRRAFENGRIDLTRAEGVLSLVSARSEEERRAAAALLAGGLARRIEDVRDALESIRALAEASLDFDESDTGHVPIEAIVAGAEGARAKVDGALGWERSRVARAGVGRVVLAGAPNAGKSTLFNRLASGAVQDAAGDALVSDLAGTTRDGKRAEWDLGEGVTAELVDTAGRSTFASVVSARSDDPDAIAEASAGRLVESADVVLWVVDASSTDGAESAPAEPGRTVLAWNKTDVADAPDAPPRELAATVHAAVPLSAERGVGIGELGVAARSLLLDAPGGPDAGGRIGLGARHVAALEEAQRRVQAALDGVRRGAPLDVVAEDLRAATDALDSIAGRTTPEDLLDRIFAQFCLGK